MPIKKPTLWCVDFHSVPSYNKYKPNKNKAPQTNERRESNEKEDE